MSLAKSSLKSDVIRLVSGTALAQLLLILATPLITRLFPPEAFGIAAMFSSVTAILGVVTCMRYEMAISIPKTDSEAANLVGLCIIIAVSFSFITALIAIFFGTPLLTAIGLEELVPYRWSLPMMVFASGIYASLNYWSTRQSKFTLLSTMRVVSAFVNVCASLIFGALGWFALGGLILASLLGQIAFTAGLSISTLRSNSQIFKENINLLKMKQCAVRYKNMPLASSWSALINMGSWQIPTLLLAFYFDPKIAGFYALSFKLIQMPMSLVGGAIGQAFTRRAAEARDNNTIDELVLGLFSKLLGYGLVPLAALAFVGRDVYEISFGANWAEAGIYSQILSIWAIFWFISSPLSIVILIYEKYKQEFFLSISSLAFRILAIFIGGYMQNPRIAIALFSFAGIITYSYLIFLIFKITKVKYSSFRIKILEQLKRSVTWLAIIGCASYFITDTAVTLTTTATAIIAYFLINRKWLMRASI